MLFATVEVPFEIKQSNVEGDIDVLYQQQKKTHTEPHSTYEKIKSRSLMNKKMTA